MHRSVGARAGFIRGGHIMHAVRIDRTKPLAAEPNTGHNRYHPDIAPLLEVGESEEVSLETRDGVDGQITTLADLAKLDAGRIHPLTGPVFVKGAEPGDMLEVEFVDILPQPTAFSAVVPGLGFLRDVMTTPFVVQWKIRDGFATAAELPGVRIPGASFMGISATAPSAQKLKEWTDREQRALDAGGFVLPPSPDGAVPGGPCGLQGLRTLPPRENGGNFDVKQLTKGARLFLPVFAKGALFSTGDGHFAQGDGEVCVTAVEMGATAVVRFKVHKGLATKRTFAGPVFAHPGYFQDPKFAAPQNFIAVMGMPVNAKGDIESENLTLAARNAVLNMIDRRSAAFPASRLTSSAAWPWTCGCPTWSTCRTMSSRRCCRRRFSVTSRQPPDQAQRRRSIAMRENFQRFEDLAITLPTFSGCKRP